MASHESARPPTGTLLTLRPSPNPNLTLTLTPIPDPNPNPSPHPHPHPRPHPHPHPHTSNPRVKNKEKYRKAVISRGGQVRKVIAQDGTYAGETSGIKKNVSHSVRYK